MSKKTKAQLDREVDEILARPKTGSKRSTAELERDLAALMGAPRLREPNYERALASALREKHTKARVPTLDELARAYSYIEREYVTRDGIDGEQWAEGLAFGQRSSVDIEDKEQARHALEHFDHATWLTIAERANYLASEQGEPQRYKR